MLFRDVLNLIAVETTENSMGDIIEVETPRQVFANKKSIRQTEFYQAQATGLRPELMFEVMTLEYQGEPKLSYDGKEYSIIRVYDKNGEITELICSSTINGVN
ncbi:phage head closure protein [Robertmurraya korlensis]|uniref:phage head closure protein n=1 Tax=Robertmurraya korlensis TaxID=519977 RepID=UPI0020418B1C|nr:phage head closure protein [Robertmurraya korlensis]MCM3600633.1 phage head closure protein [Robertmurraya korlensis]